MTTKEYYQSLRELARKDLSAAHLKQHNFTANLFAFSGGIRVNGAGAWSSSKPSDTATLQDGRLYGTKFWVSGLDSSTWGVFAVKENSNPVIVYIDFQQDGQPEIEHTPTIGMENTSTGSLSFFRSVATKLFARNDPAVFSIDYCHDLAFLSNHIGLIEGVLEDIIAYSHNDYDYTIKKIRLDLEVLKVYWQQQIEQIPVNNLNTIDFWDTRLLFNGFAKKILVLVTNLWTEITGSSLYCPEFNTHQRYKDALIYSTHFKSLPFSIKNYFQYRDLY